MEAGGRNYALGQMDDFSLFVIRYSLFILKKFPIFSTKTAKNPLVPLDDFSISNYYMTFNKEFFLEP